MGGLYRGEYEMHLAIGIIGVISLSVLAYLGYVLLKEEG